MYLTSKKTVNVKLFSARFLMVLPALIVSCLPLFFGSIASATPNCATNPPTTTPPAKNLYIFTGNGSFTPTSIPKYIYTADGTIINECGQSLPAPYGTATSTYPNWIWNYSQTGAALGWANLNGTKVIQNVIAMGFGKMGKLSAAYTGSFYVKCLQYTPNPSVGVQKYLQWDSSNGTWVSITSAVATGTAACNNS
ncbi:MAG TPA: hypothetical protein VLH38_04840 [Patescibacteria group bacterium]|nr:hypothetical protein [Patescibacteria group bacterium]